MRTDINSLIRKATNSGFQFSIPDALAAAEYLQKEYAAIGVTLPAIDPDGNECGFSICLEKGVGFYSQYVDV